MGLERELLFFPIHYGALQQKSWLARGKGATPLTLGSPTKTSPPSLAMRPSDVPLRYPPACQDFWGRAPLLPSKLSFRRLITRHRLLCELCELNPQSSICPLLRKVPSTSFRKLDCQTGTEVFQVTKLLLFDANTEGQRFRV